MTKEYSANEPLGKVPKTGVEYEWGIFSEIN